MKVFLAYFVIGLTHFVHIMMIALNIFLILYSPELIKSVLYLCLGILWAILYSDIYNTHHMKWAENILENRRKQ